MRTKNLLFDTGQHAIRALPGHTQSTRSSVRPVCLEHTHPTPGLRNARVATSSVLASRPSRDRQVVRRAWKGTIFRMVGLVSPLCTPPAVKKRGLHAISMLKHTLTLTPSRTDAHGFVVSDRGGDQAHPQVAYTVHATPGPPLRLGGYTVINMLFY